MTEPLPVSEELNPFTIWDDYRPTRLIELPQLARLAIVGRVFAKAEGDRPLGSFKMLGGMVAGLRALARLKERHATDSTHPPHPARLICASDGNHGLAVAAAAKRGGARASIYLPSGVSTARARRIESLGGEIVWVLGTYDDAVREAAAAAARGEGTLISDTSPDPNDPAVRDVMSGYSILTSELVSQFDNEVKDHPSHLFIQAGVGGLAAAVAQGMQPFVRAPGTLLVVEPQSAACVAHALAVGRPERAAGDLKTVAEMLSCGLASASAVEILKLHAAQSVLVSEGELLAAVKVLRDSGGMCTTPSGAAGLAGLLHVAANADLRASCQLDSNSCVLLVITEGEVTEPREPSP
jgi:diaminopropionate ammonia-lyase